MPCLSSTARYSSTVTSRLGPEWRSAASGRSRRMTCAWQSIATIGLDDNGLTALAVLRLELRGGEEALLECFHVVDAHDLVQLLEGHQRFGPVDHFSRIERLLEEFEATLHAAQRTRGEEARIDDSGHAEGLKLLGGKERRRRALANAETPAHRHRMRAVAADPA